MQTVESSAPRSNCAFTLVELMVAAAVFGILAGGLAAGILQARRVAEQNVYHISALTIAQGYLEQMKSMSYGDLSTDPGVEIPTELNYGDPDPLLPETWNEKRIDIHDTPGDSGDDMKMWVRPKVTEASYRKEILVDFRWEAPGAAGGMREFEESIRAIRSPVP